MVICKNRPLSLSKGALTTLPSIRFATQATVISMHRCLSSSKAAFREYKKLTFRKETDSMLLVFLTYFVSESALMIRFIEFYRLVCAEMYCCKRKIRECVIY